MKENSKVDYKSAGVDIDAGNEAVQRIKSAVTSTYTDAVLSEVGGFGSFFDLKQVLAEYENPVLVQSIDGVGTKTIIARKMDKYDTIGHDLLSACANDILVQGARPLTFLDYVASDKLKPAVIEEIVRGMAAACRATGVSLVGGETAEMPDTYLKGEHDLVGIITGVVDRKKIINGSAIKAGDILIGIESSGLHTNGYSLARKLFFEVGGYDVDTVFPDLEKTVGKTLLEPHINYTNLVMGLLDGGAAISGIAHITGGGFLENIPRVLPEGCSVQIKGGSWPVLPVFSVMQKLGNLDDSEMYRTFNMGIGLILAVPSETADSTLSEIKNLSDLQAYRLGEVVSGNKTVELI